ncbi:hypothetical protein PYW07_011992 [Mythimna separata]|uniref:C-type lectin domain-containing protein n=1 Tax=Mythimna separata TaxID=271217 RepID=A0AAD7YLX4_MYTSE|nr:hypothetical protein PYW07_011992 [Mythimna separata]
MVGVECKTPQGFIVHKSARKAYKVMYQAKPWVKAREECQKMGATLAVPKSHDEFQFLQKLVRGMYYPHITGTSYKLLVWLGINNIEDYTIWRNIDGEDIKDTGFSGWASSHGFSNDPAEPHCAGIDAVNPGLRDYWCHLPQPYICQIKVSSFGLPDYNNINEAAEHLIHEQFIFQDR